MSVARLVIAVAICRQDELVSDNVRTQRANINRLVLQHAIKLLDINPAWPSAQFGAKMHGTAPQAASREAINLPDNFHYDRRESASHCKLELFQPLLDALPCSLLPPPSSLFNILIIGPWRMGRTVLLAILQSNSWQLAFQVHIWGMEIKSIRPTFPCCSTVNQFYFARSTKLITALVCERLCNILFTFLLLPT